MIRLQDRKGFIPDEVYYQQLVAKAILFKQTEKLVHMQHYGGYRANIVTYVISFLSYKTGQRIDLGKIWKEQELSPVLENEIVTISKFVQKYIVNPPGGANVGEWCKKEKCWDLIKSHNYEISKELSKELISGSQTKNQVKQVAQSITVLTEEEKKIIAEVESISSDVWFSLSKWAKETNNFLPWQRSLLFSVGRAIAGGKPVTIKQAVQAKVVYQEAKRKGF